MSVFVPPMRNGASRADTIIVIPPMSPSETNPPLGPAILSAAAHGRGLEVEVVDLNILYMNEHAVVPMSPTTAVLGDHGKDRSLVRAAARLLWGQLGFADEDVLHLPDDGDPAAGMHYSFEAVWRRVEQAGVPGSALRDFVDKHVLSRLTRHTKFVGVSLMGPSQVFVGLLVLFLVKSRHPGLRTVIGGSHVTLLASEIEADARYRKWVDVVLTGHAEDDFTDLLGDGVAPPTAPAVRGTGWFVYEPVFDDAQLASYAPDRLVLPLQFTRGCSYGRCTFCTYPVVEPAATALRAEDARRAIENLVARHGVRQFSLKDSLFNSVMLESLSRVLLRAPALDVRWSATTKVSRRLIKLAPLLAAAGLRTVELGVESIHRRGQALIDKRVPAGDVEEVVHALVGNGVAVVVNLMFGLPGETRDEAVTQLEWFRQLRRSAGGSAPVDCSMNLLEIVRGSPLAARSSRDLVKGIAPWAYSYDWDAPTWRREFAALLEQEELARAS